MPFSGSSNQLEDDFADDFGAWQAEKTPVTTGALLRRLEPTIRKGISINAGGDSSPTTLGHARKLTLSAIRTYDPTKAKLSTHVINNLQGLRRFNRQRQQVLRVPEQVSLSRTHLGRMSSELEDQLGREPTDDELGDYTGWSPRKLERVRAAVLPASEGMFAGSGGSDEESAYEPATYQPGAENSGNRMLLGAIYADLNPVNKKIFEWTLGWNGNDVLQNQEIAKRLNLSPGAISQRKAIIQQQLLEASQLTMLR